MMRKKLVMLSALICICTLSNGCKHTKPNAKEIYMKYLKSHIKR
jgi:hypothetical protein